MEKHYVTGVTFDVKDQLKELGCQFDSEAKAWYHTDKAVAEQAQALVPAEPEKHRNGNVHESEPRHHLTGDGRAVREQLKEMGCRWDGAAKQWYAASKEVAEQAQSVIDLKSGRRYLTGNCYPVIDKLKELHCRFDGESKRWHHTDKAMAEQAQELVDRGAEKHFVQDAPHALNRQLRDMGCRWDLEGKGWYHLDPEKVREADRLVQEHLEKGKGRGAGFGTSYVAHSVAKEMTQGM
ncbi:MAG: hypothetical protein LBP68_00280 [Acidobacteriota bacterium]|jgi:hypothetical protein|nr:hypothetical protein [Acidobacteriota bacterium]